MQSTAGQSFPGRVHQQKMKRRIILRITLAAAWLTPRLAQNPPSEIKVSVPFGGGPGALQDWQLLRWIHNIRQYMSYKIAITGRILHGELRSDVLRPECRGRN